MRSCITANEVAFTRKEAGASPCSSLGVKGPAPSPEVSQEGDVGLPQGPGVQLPRWAQLHRHRRSLSWGRWGSIQEEWANHGTPAEDGGAVGSPVSHRAALSGRKGSCSCLRVKAQRVLQDCHQNRYWKPPPHHRTSFAGRN